MLSICIPSRNEVFLQKTILDVLEKATGEVEIFPVLDGYEPPENEIVKDPRVHYIRLPKQSYLQKRHGVNKAVEMAQGEYVMSLDAHCMMAKGFDEVLARDHQPNWIQVPRRNRLDAENWCIQKQSDNRPPIDYEYIMWPLKFDMPALHGFKWDARTRERADIMQDDTMTYQGSCFFVRKDYFKHLGLMQIEGYTGWGQESEEVIFKVFRDGGRVVTNKKTNFSHLHKGRKYGRMYFMGKTENRQSYEYSYNYWVHENKDLFIKYIEKFWPVVGWPENWKEQLYNNKK